MDQFGNYKGETMIPEEDSAYDFHLARYQWAASFFFQSDMGFHAKAGQKYSLDILRRYILFHLSVSLSLSWHLEMH